MRALNMLESKEGRSALIEHLASSTINASWSAFRGEVTFVCDF